MNEDIDTNNGFILDDDKDIDLDSLSIIEIEEQKREIYTELDTIDKKSVRALRENNEQLLKEYEQKAQELRKRLKELNNE